MLTGDSRFQPQLGDVAATILDGEVVMINLSTGMYYSINGAGGVIWELITRNYSLDEISEMIAQRYGIAVEQGAGDVRSLLEQLLEENLVGLSSEEGSRATPAPSFDGAPSSYVSPTLEIYRDIGHLVALDPPMPGLSDLPWSKEAGDDPDRRD